MKKIIAIFTVFVMLISLCISAYASDNADAERTILADIKARIPTTDSFENFNSTVQTRSGMTTYHFNWESSEENGEYRSMNVSVTSEGIVTSYSSYNSSDRQAADNAPAFKKISSDEAVAKAKELANRLNPMLANNILLTKYNKYESLTGDDYSFLIQRTQNGIPVYGDTGYISISSDTLAITGYHLSYTPGLAFPDADSALTQETAQSNYKEKIGMKLVYRSSYEKEHTAAYLAYIPENTGVYINAISGETVSPISPVYLYSDDAVADKNESMISGGGGDSNRFSEAEIKELENLANLMGIDTAEKALRENKLLSLTDSMILKASSVSSDSDKNYFYNLSFASEATDAMYASITLNALTGQITRIRRSGAGISHDFTEDIDSKIALEYAQLLAPDYCRADGSGEYRLETHDGATFEFVRYINDIPYYDNKIYLSINSADSTIVNYSISRLSAEFPAPDGIISASDASDKLFEQVGYTMTYYPSCTAENTERCDTALLVYMLDSAKSNEIYADSGKLVSYGDEPEIGNYTDIEGHYAEDVIKTLAKYGVGFEDSLFCPDSVITQKDFIALVTDSILRKDPIILSSDFDYTANYKRAVSNGIVTPNEQSPDSVVTRELAAVYIIRAAGYDEIASLDGIYISEFADVSEYKGHISILSAMGIINGYNGMFNPDNPLTRADAMILIYNWLSR